MPNENGADARSRQVTSRFYPKQFQGLSSNVKVPLVGSAYTP
jgi:hypothetical protein